MPSKRRNLLAASGAGDDPLYVEDVFSTYLYDGVSSGQMYIQNGIDLSGEGGLIWIKSRGAVYDNFLFSTGLTSANNYLRSNTTGIEDSTSLAASFESDGFKLNSNNGMSYDGAGYGTPYVSWTFRKAENFFTQLTFTADDSFMSPAHGLGSKPGMVIYKCTTSNTDASDGHWWIWVEGMANNKTVNLDTNEVLTGIGYIGDTDATTSTFYTTSGQTYVAYYFGNDQAVFGADSDESIIKCGTYEGTAADNAVSLGWEPQYVLIKNVDNTDNWIVFDMMRGVVTGGDDAYLNPNTTASENSADYITFGATGFTVHTGYGIINESGSTYIYMAIRRPMKVPTAGTEVFALDTAGGTAPTPPLYISGFPVDMAIYALTLSTTYDRRLHTRLLGETSLATNSTRAEAAATEGDFDYQDGWNSDSFTNATYISWMFKRAPEFMDVVAYTGTGATNNESHGLTVIPELIIAKSRDAVESWFVSQQITGVTDWDVFYEGWDSTTAANETGSDRTSQISATTFNTAVFSNNTSTKNYIAYLFATLAGISKVGSYTGTAASLDLDMGFAAGARFFLTKRTDAVGDWYIYDSLRGIVAGNDPYLLLNSTAAEVTTTDYVDPLAAGITLTAAGSSTINVSGGTYIFLAIA